MSEESLSSYISSSSYKANNMMPQVVYSSNGFAKIMAQGAELVQKDHYSDVSWVT